MKPILCLDFDGVIHSYTSPWTSADVIPDSPVPGAMLFIANAADHFTINIYSSRMTTMAGRVAIVSWMRTEIFKHFGVHPSFNGWSLASDLFGRIKFPETKPPAFVTIDDRAITFTGVWPDIQTLKEFKPWNK